MSWRTVLVEEGELLKLKLDNIVIIKDENEFVIPLSDISIIVIDGRKTMITLPLLAELSKNNIALLTCDHTHHPVGIYHGFNGHSRVSKVIQKQIALNEDLKNDVWGKIIVLKIENQLEVLKNYVSELDESVTKLKGYLEQVKPGDITNREGHAAKVYFNSLFGVSFSRQQDDNIINIALNYGYSILRAHMARLVVAYGLSPLLGIFHKSEYNAFNLVDDLMEPFRPFIDIYVVKNFVNERYFKAIHRQELVGLMTKRVIYKESSCTLITVFDRYVCDFLNIIENGKVDKLIVPKVSDFEVTK